MSKASISNILWIIFGIIMLILTIVFRLHTQMDLVQQLTSITALVCFSIVIILSFLKIIKDLS